MILDGLGARQILAFRVTLRYLFTTHFACVYRPYSKLLYDITSSYGTSATIVQAWIRRLNEKIRGTIRYTEQLRSVLVNRVAHLRHKLRGLKGGRARECFFGQTWNLQLQPDETDASNAEIETLQAKLDSSEKEKSKLQETVKLLQSTPTQKRHKPYEQLSERQKRRMKRRRESTCEASLSWLDQDGYEPLSVEVRNRETGNIEKISLKRHDMEELFGSESSITESEMDELNMMLYVKDRYNVSDGAYHEMAKVCKEMPRQYKLKERIRKLNQEWNIRPTPNGTVGVQQSLEQRLRIRIEQLLKVSSPNSTFCQSRKVRIKLSGDGTKIGKRLHVVSFTFTILEQGERPGSYEGNHILAVFKEPEDYDSVKNALADIIKEVEQLQKIEVDGITYELEYYMGGDWKFLAMITGIDSASCAYACIWCKCKADERYDADREWSISDPSKGARSTDENIKMSRQPRTRKQYNVSRLPLFPTIPLDHVVIDNLHLFLRVADVLINLLIIELRRQDAIQKQLKFTRFDPLKYRHCDAFQQFVSSLGIPGFHFYIGESSKQLKVRSLTGPEKLKVFEHIEIHTLLPSVLPSECDVDKIQHLWTELWLLNMEICKPASELTTEVIERYERRARQWGKDFIDVYHTTESLHIYTQ